MKFSASWLAAHLETDADAATIAQTLTRIGLEVESVTNPAAPLSAFRIARVLSADPHPQADKLQVLSVDAGDGPCQVVCGAPNARAGLIGVFGPVGAIVPANGMELKRATIRGVESAGMMCSSRELELGDDHDGIIELAADAPVGAAYAPWAGLDDPVFDVAITPNRQDCMGVRGIAHDLAAAGLGRLRPLAISADEATSGSFACPVPIRTEDAEGCPAFYGRVICGVRNAAAPAWMQARLKSAGQRSISALVDITNYVMLDLGRPSHAYDLRTLTGAVVARRARDGESVTVLGGQSYTLTSEMTVIADDVAVHDIAGIKGGEHSGCTEDTTDVLLEVAYFTPERIARTGQALSLASDARTRFERGVDPAFLDHGLGIITALILEICGGEASHVVRAGTPPLISRTIAFDPALVLALGGLRVDDDRQRAILTSLGFGVSDDWRVTVPGTRRDVDGVADIVEEIVRIVGIDQVPSTPLPRAPGVTRPTATPAQLAERKLRRTAAARGLDEAITWSFVSESEAAAFGGGAFTLANPISEDLKVMRPTLLAGLLSAAQRNAARGLATVRLFEIGRRYRSDGELPTLALVLSGLAHPRSWAQGKARSFDAFDAKAEALALLAAAGAPTDSLQVMGEAGGHFHPGQSATLRLGPKTILASFGMIHPATARAFDLSDNVAMAELYLDAIPARKRSSFLRSAYAPPSLQAVMRDFAFVVRDDVASGDLVRAVRGADKANIVDVRVFDVFSGNGIADGHKSIALEVTLQPGGQSYTDVNLKAIADRIVTAAAKIGAVLRG